MTHLLEPFDEILTTRLQPWLSRNILADGKYRELNDAFKKEDYSFQPKWQVAFPKPATPKRTYYNNTIRNAAIYFLNSIVKNVSATKIENEQRYWVSTIAIKPLLKKLKDVNELIESKSYHWQTFQGPALGSDAGKPLRDQAYIIQLLKYHLIHLYLELTETYSSLVKPDELFTVEELHQAIFQEQAQENVIVKAENNSQLPAQSKAAAKASTEFVPKPFDFNGEEEGIIPYDAIVSNPLKLSAIETKLFDLGLLKADSTFNKRRNNTEKFAAVMAIIYSKGYFKTRYITEGVSNKKIVLPDVRRFIEHRYKCYIDQQLRNFVNKDLNLKLFIANNSFLKEF